MSVGARRAVLRGSALLRGSKGENFIRQAQKHCYAALSGSSIFHEEDPSMLRWMLVAGMLGTAGSALLMSSTSPAYCDAAESPKEQNSQEERRQQLKSWLRSLGAQIDDIDVAPMSEGSGLGVQLASRPAQLRSWRDWIWSFLRPQQDVVLARFPLSIAITPNSVTSQPGTGPIYGELLESGACDERLLIMLFLVVEKLRGEASSLAPWLALLPPGFDTPLHYSEEELLQLKGTTLHYAARILNKNLELTWKRLEPLCKEILKENGTKDILGSISDFRWAYSVFWSRAQTFPDPDPEGRGLAQEGIVPGLDFCNHHFSAPCRWTVFGARTAGEEVPSSISLVARRRDVPKVGEEVSINYGDKSNEELLLLYGFTVDDNPHDMLMLRCPLPPVAEWGELLKARAALLQQRGLSPQLFLPAASLRGTQDAKGQKGNAGDRLQRLLPPAAWETLEVLVMEPPQLLQELEAAEQPGSQGPAPSMSNVEAAGLRLAVMTTLVRLLEVKLVELEGPEGTGPLEEDVSLLEAHLSAGGGGKLSGRLRDCVVYRAGQKCIARIYLQLARAAVMEDLERMQQLLREDDGERIRK